MATTSSSATVPVATNVTPATSVWGDLFGVIDGAFERYAKFDQYQLGKKQVSALKQQTDVLNQIADAQYQQASSPLGNDQMMQIALIGVIGLAAVYLLAKA